ncbi:MAG: MlaD family protein, partial [Acidobacteriota bacterium]|nr:MlaD family protein [Acidobacteriota bacterium]
MLRQAPAVGDNGGKGASMDREARIAEAKVGVFVVVALAILVFVSLWVAGSTLFRGVTVPYTVVMKQSGGVRDGDRVHIAGVEVGRITRISLRPGEEWPVVMGVAVDQSVTLRTDASAAVATAGFLGAAFLQIDVGSPDAEVLAPGGEIRGRDTMGFDDAMARVGDLSDGAIELMSKTGGILDQISDRIGPILSRLEALMSEENAQSLQATLDSLEKILDDNGPRLSSMLA